MTRFLIQGLKEPRGSGSGWETAEQAEDFCRELATNSLWQSMFMAEGTKIADLKICEFDFQFKEPEVKIVRIERDETELMPWDDEDRNSGTCLVKTGKKEVLFELYVDGVFEGSFPTEKMAKDFVKTIGDE